MSSQAAPDPTATTTVTTAQPQVVRVHLRAQNDDDAAAAAAPDTNTEGSQHVRWQACTVDNENLGRKSSKICCIYHKQREFGESSSESSESDGGSDRRNAYEKAPQQRKKGRHRKHGPCRHHDDAGPSE